MGRIRFAGAAIFVAALLLFAVQPMVAKALLAWYGGAPMVWAVALFFFQSALLAGYLYAHLLATRTRPRVQVFVHLALLAVAAVASLPPVPDAGWAPAGGEAPPVWILLTLLATLGLPFAALAATTPLVSAWIGGDSRVYRLYAVSNAGSLLGLALYPLVLEPFSGLIAHARWWSFGFVGLALLTAATGLLSLRGEREEPHPPERSFSFHFPAFGLAAAGSLTLVAVTTHLTRDVAAVPFLWAAPLGLYLLGFILAFRGGTPYPRSVLAPLLTLSVAACLWVWFRDITSGLDRALVAHAAAALAFLFLACWIIHGEIARRKPAPARLTGFYLSLTAGGALGGLAASLGSPLVFPNVWEYPLALVLAVAVAGFAARPRGARLRLARNLVVAGTLGFAVALAALEHRRPLAGGRNFFGVVRVMEAFPGDPEWRRDLWHGGIAHGSQWFDPARRREPTLYYYEGTGIWAALTRHPKRDLGAPLRVGVVGLGAGSVLVHAEPGDLFRFHEIDPQVVSVAEDWFTFLEDSPASVEVVLGDGRLGLAREAAAGEPGFDVLVLDAFAGDAIPVHLLTSEAFDLYASRLAPGGVLAVHISNRHVDLAPVVRSQAERLEFLALLTASDPEPERYRYTSTWVLLSRNADFVTDPGVLGRAEPWGDEATDPAGRFRWTDDYSNLLGVLR